MAYLAQEPGLFAGAARDNVTLSDPSIRPPIASPPPLATRARTNSSSLGIAGTTSVVAGGGGNAAAANGNAWRLRGRCRRPLLLVLDEATSALDPLIEKVVMDAVRRRGVACIVIAHRLSTVRDCDLILVMRQGRSRRTGRARRELMALDGLYCRLVET